MSQGYTISEEYTLPSLGKVYDVKVNPVVKLRSMTTEDEMKRLSPSERSYKNLCEIIDDCLVEDPGISAYDMCLADYIFLLHKLRVVTYGSGYNVDSVCPFCGSTNNDIIQLDEMEVKYFDENNFVELSQFVLPKTGKNIKIRMQTPRMMDDVTLRNKEVQRRTKGHSGDSAFLYTIQEMIDTINGKVVDVVTLEDFVRKLPMMDTNYIAQHALKLVESFGIDNTVNRTCPICGLDYTSSFRLTEEFFRPRIDI